MKSLNTLGKIRTTPYLNQHISSSRTVKMPRRIREPTRSGCFWAYSNDSVEPQEPPNTQCHFGIPTCLRSDSISSSRCAVVFSRISAFGVNLPAPRWSKRTTRYTSGLKYCVLDLEVCPPGPPWRKSTINY